jgi:cobalt-precorrin-5B (C1)-methyltransferase
MRNGFATSACAAAAASAAIRTLMTNHETREVVIDLPALRGVRFEIFRCEKNQGGVLCGVIKDAGDDPDVTNGLEIQALVEHGSEAGITLLGGAGVGVVTLPGLPVDVGEPAINPGPRRLIRKIVQDTLKELSAEETNLRITIIVPEGEKTAQQTMNPKLGIIGGISILGTDGLVRPYSLPTFRASIYYEMNVAREAGYTSIALATGKRSAAYLRTHLNDARGLGVVDVGDELGYPIKQAQKFGFTQVTLGGMIGKFSKLAQGRFQTHVQEGEVNFEFLAELAAEHHAPREICERILTARTAHQIQGWLSEVNIRLEPELARRAARHAAKELGGGISARAVIFSLDGELLADEIHEAVK